MAVFKSLVWVVALVVLTGMGACSGGKTVEPEAGPMSDEAIRDVLLGRVWVAEFIAGDPVVDASHTSMVFNEDGTVRGRGGCNVYAGRFTLENGTILFSPFATTMKACPPALEDQEDRFFEAMEGRQRIWFDKDLLHLAPDGEAPTVLAAMAD